MTYKVLHMYFSSNISFQWDYFLFLSYEEKIHNSYIMIHVLFLSQRTSYPAYRHPQLSPLENIRLPRIIFLLYVKGDRDETSEENCCWILVAVFPHSGRPLHNCTSFKLHSNTLLRNWNAENLPNCHGLTLEKILQPNTLMTLWLIYPRVYIPF